MMIFLMSYFSSTWHAATPTRRIVILLLIGLLIRVVISPFITYDYDVYAWALILSNVNSGNGLYELTGLYYTPVWGYCLSFFDGIINAFSSIDVFGFRFTDLLPIEDNWYCGHIATLTTVGFGIAMKIPLIATDLLVGYLLYYLLKDYLGNEERALKGAAFWLFCPIVFYMSTVGTQFDCVSALFLLLTIILLRRNMNLLGGLIFALAGLLKFFPLFTITILIAYLVAQGRPGTTKQKAENLGKFAIGAILMTVVILLPDIINGDLSKSVSFITSRFSTLFSGGESIKMTILVLLGLIVVIIATYRTYVADAAKTDDEFFQHLLMILTPTMMVSLMPQYAIVLLPLLIIMAAKEGRAYSLCLVVIGISTVLDPLAVNNTVLAVNLVEWYGVGNANWIVWTMSRAAADFNLEHFILYATLVAEGFALLLTFFLTIQPFFTKNHFRGRVKAIDRLFDGANWALNKIRGYEYEP